MREYIKLGSITIYYYSILIMIGVVIAFYLSKKEANQNGLGKKYIDDLLFYLVIFGILGARLYYVIFNFSYYKSDLLSIFKIWEGGIAIYGAVIAGIITIYYYSKKKKKDFLLTLDTIAPGLILAQSIGRWGNFFNHEAYGKVVSLSRLHDLHIPNSVIREMYINGAYHHPTFLYESLWCLIGFIILLIIRNKTKDKYKIVTYSYFIYYGIGRFLIEGLRTDSLYLFNFRVSKIVSIILIIIGIIGIVKERNKKV